MAFDDGWGDLYHVNMMRKTCTCPTCKIVWTHRWDLAWIREHYGQSAGPITCPECGTRSVAGKKIGPRKIYREPQPEPILTRTERQKPGWFGRKKAREITADYEYER
ncbi:MAG: hypothetical protein M0Z36_06700 [Thermaerobacter sp.]|nr:hypothetical protein [Thermaerobacter sp.]